MVVVRQQTDLSDRACTAHMPDGKPQVAQPLKADDGLAERQSLKYCRSGTDIRRLTTHPLEENPHIFPLHLLINVGNVDSAGASLQFLLCAR